MIFRDSEQSREIPALQGTSRDPSTPKAFGAQNGCHE
jgi:hypothetical protein